jgi:cell fate regulator YaaT (PSP1 superfamily)
MELIKVNTKCDCSLMWAEIEDIEVKSGEHVIIQTKQGPKMATVRSEKFTVEKKERPRVNVFKVLRKATEDDISTNEALKEKRREAVSLCIEKIAEHKLVMKLVDVEFLIDESKAIFYFTSDGRVDFRELVKDLAHNFHVRIEMRQIGVRDEAKMVGGIGNCGKEFCCTSFLCSFEPVSVRMAKEQNLALNPMKISGACGRLMCCLSYEHSTYIELKKGFPPSGRKVDTENGIGKVVRRDILNGKVVVLFESGEERVYNLNEIKLLKK